MPTSSLRARRLAAAAAVSALAVTGLSAPAQAAPGDTDPANAAVGWLFANGIHNGANPGLAGDTALAMAEIDPAGYADQIAGVWNHLAPMIDDSTAGPSLAKATLVAQAAGVDDDALVGLLEAKVDDGTGALADVSIYDGVIAQALAARALDAGGSSEAAAARDHLISQQCADGGFGAALDNCAAGADNDSTALAVISLAKIDATAARDAGRAYLRGTQDPEGSWSSWGTPNANTTGVAAWALGESAEATRAADWLRGLQMVDAPGCDVFQGVGEVPDPQGGVVYSQTALDDAVADGVDSGAAVSIAYATPQAAPALKWVTAATGSIQLAGKKGFVKAGAKTTLKVSNIAVNDRFCVTGLGAAVPGTASETGNTVPLTLPSRTRNVRVKVADTQGRAATHVYRVLAPKKLKVKRKARVRRGGKQTVRIPGLAAGEQVRVLYKGKVVRKGKANKKGVFRATFKVGRKVGKKRIVVKGQFAKVRKGRTTFRVTR